MSLADDSFTYDEEVFPLLHFQCLFDTNLCKLRMG